MKSLTCQSVVALAILFVVTAGRATAQQRVSQPTTAAVTLMSVMTTPVMVTVHQMRLDAAIATIARAAHVRVVYQASLLDRPTLVTLQANDLPLAAAFEAVLRGTGLQAKLLRGTLVSIQPISGAATSMVHGSLTGTVRDAITQRPLRGARVSLAGNPNSVTTGDDGVFQFTTVAAGSYTMSVRLLGYRKATQSITVTDGEHATAEIRLEQSVSALDQVIVTGTIVATAQKAVPNAMTVITAADLRQRGITHIDQLFRGDVPGLFAMNSGSNNPLDQVTMFSRGATKLQTSISDAATNPIKTYIDGVELADPSYLSQLDPQSIERIEILTGPQASTVYGSNAINGVMQIFTKRGTTTRPQLTLTLVSGLIQNDMTTARTPQHDDAAQVNGAEGSWAYSAGLSWNYVGAWTPAKQTSRLGGFGGARTQWQTSIGAVRADVTYRQSVTQTLRHGTTAEVFVTGRDDGSFGPIYSNGRSAPTTFTLHGQTLGLTVGYSPTAWWSHELVVGTDVANTEMIQTSPSYQRAPSTAGDSLLSMTTTGDTRTSIRYATSAQFPVTSNAHLVLTGGADAWQALANTLTTTPSLLTGSLSGAATVTRQPDHNTGAFFQGQIGIVDALFLTYGIRAEWNPNYGADAQPNVAPRYGIAYSRDLTTPLGPLTTKVRMSYGRSTRPPTTGEKSDQPETIVVLIQSFGHYNAQIANPDLGPEFQQGGEGGVEFYLGDRASLVVTRYNQTVDHLIAAPYVDSVPPIVSTICCYNGVKQNLNIGSIRNQGWELQGTLHTGPLTTNGTYSWTKSRVLGIATQYRALLTGAAYQPGASFDWLPEHTWAMNTTYARATNAVTLNLTGTGFMFRQGDYLFYATSTNVRLYSDRPRTSLSNYRPMGPGYVMADLNATHRFSSAVEGLVQIQNLTDFYRNDFNYNTATIGRQTKAGVRVKW